MPLTKRLITASLHQSQGTDCNVGVARRHHKLATARRKSIQGNLTQGYLIRLSKTGTGQYFAAGGNIYQMGLILFRLRDCVLA